MLEWFRSERIGHRWVTSAVWFATGLMFLMIGAAMGMRSAAHHERFLLWGLTIVFFALPGVYCIVRAVMPTDKRAQSIRSVSSPPEPLVRLVPQRDFSATIAGSDYHVTVGYVYDECALQMCVDAFERVGLAPHVVRNELLLISPMQSATIQVHPRDFDAAFDCLKELDFALSRSTEGRSASHHHATETERNLDES